MQVVIPIGTGSGWNNNELRYCLRSLEKHAKFSVEPIILAEEGVSIPWLQNCRYDLVTRFYPQNLEAVYGYRKYENFFAVLGKYEWVSKQDFLEDDFLVFYDDQLLVSDVDNPKIFENVALCQNKTTKITRKTSRHDNTILEALELSHQERHHNGLYEAETHLPRLYNKVRLQKLFNRYSLNRKVPYSLYTLYRNIFYDDPDAIIKDNDCNLVAYFHFSSGTPHHIYPYSKGEIDEASKRYKVFSYTDKGLNACNELFRGWIESRFPDKSIYEK